MHPWTAVTAPSAYFESDPAALESPCLIDGSNFIAANRPPAAPTVPGFVTF